MCNNLYGPTKVVCYREVSAIKGVCYKRIHCFGFLVAVCLPLFNLCSVNFMF